MKLFSLIISLLLTVQVFATANEVVLDNKEIDLGVLDQPENSLVVLDFNLLRSSQSPSKVKLTFKFKYLKESCVEHKLQYTNVPALEQMVCKPINCDQEKSECLDVNYECNTVVAEAYEIPKRVCVKKGLIQKEKVSFVKLNFKKAVVLADGATEKFNVKLRQLSIKKKSLKFGGSVVESASKYKISNSLLGFGKTIKFKAER
ncbi:MAG: hypothetical protein HOJ35_01835 [Bdellovibrionales bacterium]|jgi:hypothetical protein|nr:hypothetical protein [Bdellovibrionales bacterium]